MILKKKEFTFHTNGEQMKKCYLLLLMPLVVGQLQAEECCYRQTEAYYDQNAGYYVPVPQYYVPAPEYCDQNSEYDVQAPEYCPEYCYTQIPEYCCIRRCRPYYIGIDAGWSFGLSKSRSYHNGADFAGRSSDARARSGYSISAEIGRQWNSYISADIQYTFLSNPFEWKVAFSSTDIEKVTAHTNIHLLLVNGFINLNKNPLFRVNYFDPCLAGGIGVAFNSLKDIEEKAFNNSNLTGDTITSHTETNFAARVAIGIMKYLGNCRIINLEFNSYYIGTLSSGNMRKIINPVAGPVGTQERIGPYKFKNNWMGTLTLGAKYRF